MAMEAQMAWQCCKVVMASAVCWLKCFILSSQGVLHRTNHPGRQVFRAKAKYGDRTPSALSPHRPGLDLAATRMGRDDDPVGRDLAVAQLETGRPAAVVEQPLAPAQQ